MLLACQRILDPNKNYSEDEMGYWRDFLKGFSLSELHYAFEHWTNNMKWLPKPSEIRELCEAYRLSEVAKVDSEMPIGCERCDWSGWYTVTWRSSVERVVAPCPCRTNVSLRTKCTKQKASLQEMAWMYAEIKRLCGSKDMNKAIEKPKQVSGIIPTTQELAAQLAKAKR